MEAHASWAKWKTVSWTGIHKVLLFNAMIGAGLISRWGPRGNLEEQGCILRLQTPRPGVGCVKRSGGS